MPKPFRHGLVIGKFYPLHAGHSHLIRTAVEQCDRVTVQLLASSVESIPIELRANWIRRDHPTVDLRTAIDDAEVDFGSPVAWDEHMAVINGLLDGPVDAVFTADDYGVELARRLNATWVQVDKGRVLNPVSGTAVRADLNAHWHQLSATVRESLVRRIVVLGAESTGSTTLARNLASTLSTLWVPEYGREYSTVRDGGLESPWSSWEFDFIVDRQLDAEREAALDAPKSFIICDTDVLATALWHERYLGASSPSILVRATQHPPLIYVLTGDEIPFVQDGLRDGEHIRADMQKRFRDVLASQEVPWFEVHGSPAERLQSTIPAVLTAVAEANRFAEPLEARTSTRR